VRFRTIGRAATSAEIRAWNIDVNASGVGLPAGRGTYARGAALFAERCAACHGGHGEGIPPFPRLIGREPRDSFPFGRDAKYVKTIGNYWPYATTVYDYINRAMPFPAPSSLRPDDIYSLVAYLLAETRSSIDERSWTRACCGTLGCQRVTGLWSTAGAAVTRSGERIMTFCLETR